mgnify:CR=1 FL=1
MFNTVQHFIMVMRSSHGSSGPLMGHQVLSLVIMSIMSFMSRQMSHVTSKNGQKWEGQIFFSNLTIPPIVYPLAPSTTPVTSSGSDTKSSGSRNSQLGSLYYLIFIFTLNPFMPVVDKSTNSFFTF